MEYPLRCSFQIHQKGGLNGSWIFHGIRSLESERLVTVSNAEIRRRIFNFGILSLVATVLF